MTRLDPIARVVFHEHDDKLLDYLKEEGQSIEPHWCAFPYFSPFQFSSVAQCFSLQCFGRI